MIGSVVVVLIVGLLYTLPTIRDGLGSLIGSVPTKNAIARTKELLTKEFQQQEIRFVYGDYRNANGEMDDMCYTSDFELNGNYEEIISATYCKKGKKDYDIVINNKEYERKIRLIKRLANDYTNQIKKQLKNENIELSNYHYDIEVITPYMNPEYKKPLPTNLAYKMKFQSDLDLEWELQIKIKNYNQTSFHDEIEAIISKLNALGYNFHMYNFLFLDNLNNATYVYDIVDFEQIDNIDVEIEAGRIPTKIYEPYGNQSKYIN